MQEGTVPSSDTHSRLRSFVERLETLEEAKQALAQDAREVLKEAQGEGFDTKALKEVLKLRKMDEGDRQEREAVLQAYCEALGMA